MFVVFCQNVLAAGFWLIKHVSLFFCLEEKRKKWVFWGIVRKQQQPHMSAKIQICFHPFWILIYASLPKETNQQKIHKNPTTTIINKTQPNNEQKNPKQPKKPHWQKWFVKFHIHNLLFFSLRFCSFDAAFLLAPADVEVVNYLT